MAGKLSYNQAEMLVATMWGEEMKRGIGGALDGSR